MIAKIDEAIGAVTRLRAALHKGSNRQVRSYEERSRIKATALSWFNSVKPGLVSLLNDPGFKEIDEGFTTLLEWAEQSATRSKYRDHLKTLKARLVRLRSRSLRGRNAVRHGNRVGVSQSAGGRHQPV